MSNLLYKTKTYLVGAMQYKNGEGWRNNISLALKEMSITIFDPYHKPFLKDIRENEETRKNIDKLMEDGHYDEVQERMKEIRAYDLNLVDRSDFIVAYIDPQTPTFGTVEELVTAVRMKKPTFIAIEGGKKKTPFWLLGMFPHKYFYNNVEEITDMLKKIDSGEKEIDSDRWRLLRKEYR